MFHFSKCWKRTLVDRASKGRTEPIFPDAARRAIVRAMVGGPKHYSGETSSAAGFLLTRSGKCFMSEVWEVVVRVALDGPA